MRFSIITITYNSEKYLDQTIESVLQQGHDDFEYLLVDGNSTDGTLGIIKEHARKDRRIRWVSEPDKGIADAMNKGIGLAAGDVIAHLHSDDYYRDGSVLLAVNAEFEKHPESLWLTGGMCIVDSSGEILDCIKVRNYSFNNLIRNNILLHPSTFVKKKAFDKVGAFDVSLRYAMDYDLWLRLGSLGDPTLLDKPLSCFRAHDESISTREVDAAFDEAWRVRKRYLGDNIFKLLINYNTYRKSRIINRKYIKSLLKDKNNRQ